MQCLAGWISQGFSPTLSAEWLKLVDAEDITSQRVARIIPAILAPDADIITPHPVEKIIRAIEGGQ